jgi:hypothetical protein
VIVVMRGEDGALVDAELLDLVGAGPDWGALPSLEARGRGIGFLADDLAAPAGEALLEQRIRGPRDDAHHKGIDRLDPLDGAHEDLSHGAARCRLAQHALAPKEKATSSAVITTPSWKRTPSRKVSSSTVGETRRHAVARDGAIVSPSL